MLVTVFLLTALALCPLAADETTENSVIPEIIPTEVVDEDIEYMLYGVVSAFEGGRDDAVAPFSEFSVSEDGGRAVLTFRSESCTAIIVFHITGEGLSFAYGFDVKLSEQMMALPTGDGVLVWLMDSNIIFAVNSRAELMEVRKLTLSDDGDTEIDRATVAAAVAFFGDGVSEISLANGLGFSAAEPLTAGDTTTYAKLILTDADGSETVLYDATAIPQGRKPAVAILGVVATVIAIAVTVTGIAYLTSDKRNAKS